MSRINKVTIELTEGELSEMMNALGHYKTVLRSRAAKRQHKFGYRDDSPSRRRFAYAQTAQRKLSFASRVIKGQEVDHSKFFGA